MSGIEDHVAFLTQEIDPHPAGTEEEQQAAFYIADRLERGANLSTAVEEFSCSLNYDLPRIIYCAVAVVMGLLTLFIPALVLPSFILTAVAAILYAVDVLRIFSFGQFFHSGVSQNVVAKYEPTSARQTRKARSRKVVFVSRYDSGKVQQELRKPFLSALPALHWAELVAIILIPVLLLIRFIAGAEGGLLIFIDIIVVICAILVLLPIVTYLIHFVADYEGGANCNAAGVAVMLEAAAYVGQGRLSEKTPMAPGYDSAVIHGEAAARERGLVPEGADLVYEAPITQGEGNEPADDSSAASRLMAAKAAVAALSGKEVSGVANIDMADYPDQGQATGIDNYGAQSQGNILTHTFDEESHSDSRSESRSDSRSESWSDSRSGNYSENRSESHSDNESFVAPDEAATSTAYFGVSNVPGTSEAAQNYAGYDGAKEDSQNTVFAEASNAALFTTNEPTTGEPVDFNEPNESANSETIFAGTTVDTGADVFSGAFDDFATGIDDREITHNAVPSWFTSAQEKAHRSKNTDEFTPVQRSRYADTLDSAMNESNVYFKQANDAITAETEQRLQHMRDSIMEVTPPSFDDINNALADADKQREESATKDVATINEANVLDVDEIKIADEDALENVSFRSVSLSDDSSLKTADEALETPEGFETSETMGISESSEMFETPEVQETLETPEASEVTEAPVSFTTPETPEGDLASSPASVASKAEESVVQPERIRVESDELYEAPEASEASEVSREEADLGRTISFIPVTIDEEQLRQEVSELNVDNMSNIPDVSRDLVQEAESSHEIDESSQNENPVVSADVEEGIESQEEQTTESERFVVPKVFSQSSVAGSDQKATTRRRRDIDLPGLTQSLEPINVSDDELKQAAPLGDDALLSHDRSQKLKDLSFANEAGESAASTKDEISARQAALRTSLPSVSGSITFEDAQSYVSDYADKNEAEQTDDTESSANVSQAGSFASVGATGVFDPIGEELVEDIAPDEIYVDDADDSDYDDQFTEMGAFAGPGYVEMPQSRTSRFFGRFRRSGKRAQEEETPQQWLNVEDDFEAREVGKARGGWESFRENDQEEDVFDAPEGFSENDNSEETNRTIDRDLNDGISAFDDEDSYDSSQQSLWDGGAFGRRRLNETAAQDEFSDDLRDKAQDIAQNDLQNGGVQDAAQSRSQDNAQGVAQGAVQGVAQGVTQNNAQDAAQNEAQDNVQQAQEAQQAQQEAEKETRRGAAARRSRRGDRRNARRARGSRGDQGAQDEAEAQNAEQSQRAAKRETSNTAEPSRAADMQRIRQFRYSADAADTEIWFVALGSELMDNSGMKAFMNEHADELKGSIIVELEGLGAGELTLVEREGTYRAAKTSSRAKRAIRKAANALRLTVDSKPMRWKDSSTACAARKGYQAMHLAGMEDGKPAYYGEADDVIDRVSEQTLRRNTNFIIEFLRNV